MTQEHEPIRLMETLEAIEEDARGDCISFGDAVEILNHRGFGALLTLPALLIVMPTGMIPGMQVLCGVFILLVSGQMTFGSRAPWLPKKLKNISVSKARFNRAVEKARTYIKRVDRLTEPRLKFLTHEIMQRFIAGLIMLLALGIMGMSLIPFVPALLAFPILFFALGLSVRDGIFMLIGFSFIALAAALIPVIARYFIP